MKAFKVECADTGAVYSLRLDVSDPSVLTKFRNQLALFASIPPQDQILLVGPPYKKFEGLQTHVDGQRLFLYNKALLTGDATTAAAAAESADVRLPPYELIIPEPVLEAETSATDASQLLEKSASPLLRALPDFERQLLRNLKRGETLLAFAEQVAASCRRCAGEQRVQADALQAATSNLHDHFDATKAAFDTAQQRLAAQQERHRQQLDSFDADLEALRSVPLCPALVHAVGGAEALAALVNAGYSAPTSSSSSNIRSQQHAGEASMTSPGVMGRTDTDLRSRSFSLGDDAGLSHDIYPQETVRQASFSAPQSERGSTSSKIAAPTGDDGDGGGGRGDSAGGSGPGSGDGSLETDSRASHSETTPPQAPTLLTLLDCVPAEKESAWARQCADVHRKVDQHLGALRQVFAQVSSGLGAIEAAPADDAFLQALSAALDDHLRAQRDGLARLRDDYHFAYEAISARATAVAGPAASTDSDLSSSKRDMMSASSASIMLSASAESSSVPFFPADADTFSAADSDGDGEVVALLKLLEGKRKAQETEVLAPMHARCAALMELKDEVARRKAALTASAAATMRAVAAVQTEIQYKLKKGLEAMKKWLQGHNSYFGHLEHVARMPTAYVAFLREVVRRKGFSEAFEARLAALVQEVHSMRAEETAARERFLREHGAHLPPVFFTMVPSLPDKPPYFSPALTEPQWLPDIDASDVPSDVSSAFPPGLDEGGDGDGKGAEVPEPATTLAVVGSDRDRDRHQDRDREVAAALEAENARLVAQVADLTRQLKQAHPAAAAAAADSGVLSCSSSSAGSGKGAEASPTVAALVAQHGAVRAALLADPEVALIIQEHLATLPPQPVLAPEAEGQAGGASGRADAGAEVDGEQLQALETLRLVERAAQAMRWKIDSQRAALEQHATAATAAAPVAIVAPPLPPAATTISYREFPVGCVALFMPLSPKRDVYMAFNSRCPHHYLSEESLVSLVRSHEQRQQLRRPGSSGGPGARLDFIIGRVVFAEGQVADAGNVYGLAVGSKYTVLYVEEVAEQNTSPAPAASDSLPTESAQDTRCPT